MAHLGSIIDQAVARLVLLLAVVCSSHGLAQTISESRHLLIEAESLEELQFQPERMLGIFNILMQDILLEDPEIAPQVVLKTHDLIEKSRISDPDGYFEDTRPGDNRTHIASFLDYYEANDESLNSIGLQVRTYRDDHAGTIQYSGDLSTTRQYAFLSHFLQCGGNYNTTRALDQMLVDLRRLCGQGNCVFLAPEFLYLCYSLRQTQREDLAQWANEKSSQSDITIASIADAAMLGASIFERAERIPFKSTEVLRSEILDNRIIEVLQDETISPSWRIGFASMLAVQIADDLATPARIEIGKLINLLASKDIPVQNDTLIDATSAFLGEHRDTDEWLTVARTMISKPDSIVKIRNGKLFKFSTKERHQVAQLIALNCRAGTKKQLLAQVQIFGEDPSFYQNIWIELVRAKQFDLANDLFSRHSKSVSFQQERFMLHNTYDDRLAKQVDNYLATIQDESNRLLAAILLAAVPDNVFRNPENSVKNSQQARLNQAISLHIEKGLPEAIDITKRIRVLELLTMCRQNQTATNLLEIDQQTLVGRLKQTPQKVSTISGSRMEMHSAIEQLSQGKHFPALFFWGRIVEDENVIIEGRRRIISEGFLNLINENLEAAIKQADTEILEAFTPFCRQMLNSYPELRNNDIRPEDLHKFVIRTIIAHAYCDQMHHWNRFWDDLPNPKKTNLAQLLQQYPTVVRSLKIIMNPADLEPGQWQPKTAVRRKFIAQLLQTKWVSEGLKNSSTLAELSALGLITTQDTSALAEPIARNAPRDGSAWREYFGTLADAGRLADALHEVNDQLAINQNAEEKNLDDAKRAPIYHLEKPAESLAYVLKLEKYLMLDSIGNTAEANQFKLDHLLGVPPVVPREYMALVRQLERR